MARRPLVMATNDDGCSSSGLLAAWHSLRNLAETLVVAPEFPMGGAGKSITVYRPLRVSSFSRQGMKGYKVDGTPADCVLLGLNKIAARRPDLVISGINLGPNLGLDDLTSSGTMGACIQASMYGIPSVCASYCSHDYSRMPSFRELATARKVIRVLIEEILKRGILTGSEILVVAIPQGEAVGRARSTRLAVSPLPDIHRELGQGLYGFLPRTLELYSKEAEDDDVTAVLDGVISLTVVNTTLRSKADPTTEELASRVNEQLDAAEPLCGSIGYPYPG